MTFTPCPKQKRWYSAKYEKWVREQGCIICGQPGQVHHAKGIGNLSGVALKAPSWAAMCLCQYHHDGVQKYLLNKEYQWEWIGKTLGKAVEEGILILK